MWRRYFRTTNNVVHWLLSSTFKLQNAYIVHRIDLHKLARKDSAVGKAVWCGGASRSQQDSAVVSQPFNLHPTNKTEFVEPHNHTGRAFTCLFRCVGVARAFKACPTGGSAPTTCH
jgi:hypothetical protein